MEQEDKVELKFLQDEELLKLLVSRKDEVMSEIYARYEKLIFFKTKSILKDHHQALDLTHDIFIKVFTNLDQFKGRSRFSLWVHSITFNTSIKYLNKKKKLHLFEWHEREDILDESAEDIDDKIILEASLDKLENGLNKLTEEERYLLFMKYTDGLSVKEICEVTGLKESNIKMRLKRTRDKLAHIIE